MTKKECLRVEFSNSKLRKNPFIAVAVSVKGASEAEVIINPIENFDEKLTYYDRAYNDNLELISCRDIKILSVAGLWDSISVKEMYALLERNQF